MPYILTLVFAGVPMFMMEVNIIANVSEPDSMSPDPDPIRIQGFYDRKWKNGKKFTAGKIFVKFFWIGNCNLLHKGRPS